MLKPTSLTALLLLTLPATASPAQAQTSVAGVVVSAQRPAVTNTPDGTSYAVAGTLQGESGTVADVLRGLPGVDVDLTAIRRCGATATSPS